MGETLGMRPALMVPALALATTLILAAPAHAQWLDFKMPAIPRTSDGRLDVTAPAPRTSDDKLDLSGLWRISVGIGYGLNVVTDLAAADCRLRPRLYPASAARTSGQTILPSIVCHSAPDT